MTEKSQRPGPDEVVNVINEVKRKLAIQTNHIGSVSDKRLNSALKGMKEYAYQALAELKSANMALSESARWNRLHVSFFGETNAGKSTIIEALTGGDGKMVGDGRKDFTRSVITFEYGNVTLVDMPGIEGNEGQVLDSIRKAVNQSHVIFYVVGTNKKPEEHTLCKLKEYLRDNAKVYSILNVRKRPGAYKWCKQLEDEKTNAIGDGIQKQLSAVLGKHYQGNIVIDGHLALLCSRRLVPRKLARDREKALKILGGPVEMKKTSNIGAVETVIGRLVKNAPDEIFISNIYKFIGPLEYTARKIASEKASFDATVREAAQLGQQYGERLDKIFSEYESEARKMLHVQLKKLGEQMITKCSKGISDDLLSTKIKKHLRQLEKEYTDEIRKRFDNLVSRMNRDIKQQANIIDAHFTLQVNMEPLSGRLDLVRAMKSLQVTLGDHMKVLKTIGIALAPILIKRNPWQFASTIISLFGASLDWLNLRKHKRMKAMQHLRRQIDAEVEKHKKRYYNNLKRKFAISRKNAEKSLSRYRRGIRRVEKISGSVASCLAILEKARADLSLLAVRWVWNGDAVFAWMDLASSTGTVIGLDMSQEEKCRIRNSLRLKHLDWYPSREDWQTATAKHHCGETPPQEETAVHQTPVATYATENELIVMENS